LGTEILVPHINNVLLNAVNGVDKPELTCISEEGIADMDFFPDNMLDGFDFNNEDENDEDLITSCNKVKYSLSEIENTPVADGKKMKRSSVIRQNKNLLALTAQVIPEISHENSHEENKTILINGHHVDCNINKHLRSERIPNENFITQAQAKFPNHVISVIEEAAV
jgi:hypothetical protein